MKSMIYNEDCNKILKDLPDACIDLIITDPPYEVNYMYKVKRICDFYGGTHKHTIDSVDDGSILDFDFISKHFYRILKDGCDLYIFCAYSQFSNIIINMEKAGFKFMQNLVWIKPNCTLDATFGAKYMFQHENILYFKKGWSKLRCKTNRTTIFREPSSNERANYTHPCQKPSFIIKRLIENSSGEGDIVFDSFAGSGVVPLVAKNMNRRFLACEIDKKYYHLIMDKLLQVSILNYVI